VPTEPAELRRQIGDERTALLAALGTLHTEFDRATDRAVKVGFAVGATLAAAGAVKLALRLRR
jgi:hypothetical protein